MAQYKVYHNGELVNTLEAEDGFTAIKATRAALGIDPDVKASWTAKGMAEPTHAELANAATKTCYCRTGADGWIFANTTQLLEFIRTVQKS
jgi:hypothetical protein